MAHKFLIEQNKAGDYVAKFKYNAELIWWTEGYSSKAGARNAIELVLNTAPPRRWRKSNSAARRAPRHRSRAGRRVRCRGGRHGP